MGKVAWKKREKQFSWFGFSITDTLLFFIENHVETSVLKVFTGKLLPEMVKIINGKRCLKGVFSDATLYYACFD